jgi:osmoprotectant transport system substrate-binding protein
MKSIHRLLILPLLALLTALTIVACTGGGSTEGGGSAGSAAPIKVGSKDFTEQFIIGEMYALALENAGLKVERKLNLGGTPVAQKGLEWSNRPLPRIYGDGFIDCTEAIC